MIEKKQRQNKPKLYTLILALIIPLSGFSQTIVKKDKDNEQSDNRAEVNFKQRHSRSANNQNLYADGIKIKRDLSIIEKTQEERSFDADEIPSDELYGGIWANGFVNVYGSVENRPDTFHVDLTNFTIPTMGHVTSQFGKRRRRMHYGIDLKVQKGDTIYAAFEGKVRLCKYERRGYGYYVVLRHSNGLETVYGHLSKFLVNEDDVVRSGDPIALGGNTGRSTGSHLHFEFRFLGRPINPNLIVDFENKVCHRDSYVVTQKSFDYLGSAKFLAGKAGTSSSSSAAYATKSSSKTPNKYTSGEVNYHRIKKGDSLYIIAKRYGTSVNKLCKLNGISTKSKLKIGQTLRIS